MSLDEPRILDRVLRWHEPWPAAAVALAEAQSLPLRNISTYGNISGGNMSYENALKAAGADVLQFKDFGSYQGDWYALVNYKGETGWVHGYYGSCSGCDSYEAEFGYGSGEDGCEEHAYRKREDCAACQKAHADYLTKLRSFGESYLGGLQTAEPILKELDGNKEWDDEAGQAAEWIRAVTKSGVSHGE
jgi:hypothetical protein